MSRWPARLLTVFLDSSGDRLLALSSGRHGDEDTSQETSESMRNPQMRLSVLVPDALDGATAGLSVSPYSGKRVLFGCAAPLWVAPAHGMATADASKRLVEPIHCAGVTFSSVIDCWRPVNVRQARTDVTDLSNVLVVGFLDVQRGRVIALSSTEPPGLEWIVYDASIGYDPPGLVLEDVTPRVAWQTPERAELHRLSRPDLEEWGAVWLACAACLLPTQVILEWLDRRGIDRAAARLVQWRSSL